MAENASTSAEIPGYKNVVLEPDVQKRLSASKRLILTFLQAIAEGDSDKMRGALRPDAQWWVPPSGKSHIPYPIEGADGVVRLVSGQTLNSFMPGTTTWTARHLVEDGDMISAHVNRDARGSNGNPYENEYNLLFRLVDGQIAEAWEVVDTVHARAQLS